MAVVRIEDYRTETRRSVAAALRGIAAQRLARLERMREAESQTIAELAHPLLDADSRT